MPDTVRQDLVIGIHFTMMDAEGETLETSEGDTPLHYLHGHHNIAPGLENALEGAALGSKHKVVVAPAEAYGERTTSQPVPKAQFPPGMELEPGAQFATQLEDGTLVPLWVVEVTGDEVMVTLDHPLAGMELHYDVEIVEIREATADEISNGSVGCSCC